MARKNLNSKSEAKANTKKPWWYYLIAEAEKFFNAENYYGYADTMCSSGRRLVASLKAHPPTTVLALFEKISEADLLHDVESFLLDKKLFIKHWRSDGNNAFDVLHSLLKLEEKHLCSVNRRRKRQAATRTTGRRRS